jgi:hypothetical protein
VSQRLKPTTVEARARKCPTCAAPEGEACRQRTDYGTVRRAKYVHKPRMAGYRRRHCESCQCFVVEPHLEVGACDGCGPHVLCMCQPNAERDAE